MSLRIVIPAAISLVSGIIKTMETKSDHSSESFFRKITYTDGIYPALTIEKNENPSRVYAIPLLGILVKTILLIPVFIELMLLGIWLLIVSLIINPFVVLLTGKYWGHAYGVLLGTIKLSTKMSAYVYGLTDKYPGFSFQIPTNLSLDMLIPQNPKRLYAIPLVGFLIRVILLIPYFIFANIISNAVAIGVFLLAWAVVLVKGRYPDGIFELARDSIRINVSVYAYMLGLSDRYPSFYFSMKHDKIKLILIAVAIIFSGWNYSQDLYSGSDKETDFRDYKYKQEIERSINDNGLPATDILTN